MSITRRFAFLSLLLVTLYAPGAGAAQHALLIGINNYQQLPPLNGAVNDVQVIRDLLLERFGFAAADIEVLTDTAATRQGILDALARLNDRVDEGDTVYLHFSGHGSQVEDLDGDEEDGKDETIAPQDARTEGVPDITDDELDRALGQLRTSAVLVTLDSCHSGTGLRNTALLRTRFVPPDTRLALYRRSSAVRTRAVVPLAAEERYVLFTGAAAYQSALDGPFADGRYHGLFTYAYTRTLAQLRPGATAQDVMRGVEREVRALRGQLGGFPPPEPQLEAPPERLGAPLLLRAAGAPLPVAGVTSVDQLVALLTGEDASVRRRNGFELQLSAPEVPLRLRGISLNQAQQPRPRRIYEPGTPRTRQNSLQLEVAVSRDCYLTVYVVDASDTLQQVFPNALSPANYLPAGKMSAGRRYLIPDELSTSNRAGFLLDFGPPAGTDRIIGVCTTTRAEAEALRTAGAAPETQRLRAMTRFLRESGPQWTGQLLTLMVRD